MASTEFPEVVRFSELDQEAAAAALAELLRDRGIASPLVISSPHGRRLLAKLDAVRDPVTPIPAADQAWADRVGSQGHRAGADAVVAIGGGRVLDVAKLAAVRAGVNVVAVPTQLSHDGICSPVAVVPNEAGIPESLGAIAPRVVFLSTPTLLTAPVRSISAGLGDLLANPFALRDWTLAADRGLETIDERAWDLSERSFSTIEKYLDRDASELVGDADFLDALADALVLSGMAMICSGTSRPASGGEHEISHAIDELYGGRAMHGAQVAFGCLAAAALYEDDVAGLSRRLDGLGLPSHPDHLELSEDDIVAVLLHAPSTRPGRFTIVEDADLDEARARQLVRKIWYRDH